MSCIFCQLAQQSHIYDRKYFYALWDIDPIQNGHLLLISREHRLSFQELSQEEKLDLLACQEELLNLFKAMGRDITLAINNAGLMDQGTHFHQHFIPREKSDGFWEGIQLEQRPFDREMFEKAAKTASL